MRLTRPILEILNEVSGAAGVNELTSVFGTSTVARPQTNNDARRLRSVVADSVSFLLTEHEWDGLWVSAQFNVPAGVSEIPFPPDFDRIRTETFFRQNEGWWRPYGPDRPETWNIFKNYPHDPLATRWRFGPFGIILMPIPDTDEVFEFEYITRLPVADVVGKLKPAVTYDDDAVLYPEDVFRADLKWRILRAYGESFDSEYAEYERIKSRRKATQGGGGRTLSFGGNSQEADVGYNASDKVVLG